MATGIARVTDGNGLQLVFLHALPLDGTMWTGQEHLLPGSYAPTLYRLGDTVDEWAHSVLAHATGGRLIVVGCSVGGSCALEMAHIAPNRVTALVLIGTKAKRNPNPAFHATALETLQSAGVEKSWEEYWAPLFSPCTDAQIVGEAKAMALRLPLADIARGVNAFHTRSSRDDVLATFAGPITVVTGADDSAPGPHTSALQANAASNGRLHVIADCGHYVPLERPDALNDILREIIAFQG